MVRIFFFMNARGTAFFNEAIAFLAFSAMTGAIGMDSARMILGLPTFFFMKEAMDTPAAAYLAASTGVKGFFGCGMTEVD